jgi:biopolymer transport protein ExbD
MEFWQRKRANRLIINVTSLIDVMFLLLIFFMVTSTFKNQPAIQLMLPRSASAEDVPMTPAVLYLTAEGTIYLNQRVVSEAELGPALRRLQSEDADDRIILRADARAAHGDVVRLIDQVKESGFTRVSLSARREEGP